VRKNIDTKYRKYIREMFFLSFFLFSFNSFSQIVEELFTLDTINETYKVIYKPQKSSSYYFKKIAVFADDTSQIAIEKTYTSYAQNGVYKVYYPSGRLKLKTVYANNKIYGEWTWYDEKGIILVKGKYKEGIKHGFWAYKSLKIYGRYKKGLKHKKWKRLDENEKKHFSYYKKGVLVRGEGYINDKAPIHSKKDTAIIKKETIKENSNKLSNEYEQAISFLTKNVILRKEIKKYFGGSIIATQEIKKQFKRDKFQYVISPTILALGNASFYEESTKGKIKVAIIDSLLKTNTITFSSAKINVVREDSSLYKHSTDNTSPMVIYFGELKSNLMRIDVLKLNEIDLENNFVERYSSANESQKFSILLYFNNSGQLKGAEYQKP
jgi:hypothetical protein